MGRTSTHHHVRKVTGPEIYRGARCCHLLQNLLPVVRRSFVLPAVSQPPAGACLLTPILSTSCTKAKNIVGGLGLPEGSVGILELDEMGEEGAAIQDYLASETGQRTV